MLQNIIPKFINYCKHYHFSLKAIQAFKTRLGELDRFLNHQRIHSLCEIQYDHLIDFVTTGNPSVHVKKVRVWTLHQFFHYLEFHKLIKVNIAQQLPYPKIDKHIQQFLTLDELMCPEMDIFCLLSVFSIDYDDRIIILK